MTTISGPPCARPSRRPETVVPRCRGAAMHRHACGLDPSAALVAATILIMKARELAKLGIPKGDTMRLALDLVGAARRNGHGARKVRQMVADVAAEPARFRSHQLFGALASALAPDPAEARRAPFLHRDAPAPWRQWGELEGASIEQMENACKLPVAVRGALMPDAHVGYGLPIGGVLATAGAVIPYAVGVDIACRMKMSVLDMPVTAINGQADRLAAAIETETRFGIGAQFDTPREHPVLDEDWDVSPITQAKKDKARKQLGTSGSGNHFVEFGTLTVEPDADSTGLDVEPGTYVALLSHSGSRGTGAAVADHYAKLATKLHPELPKSLRHLAWLELETDEGREYWAAMELMGRYAAANHAVIHRAVARHLRADVLADVENHHNFAWRERHDGRDVIVHRKGATPAADGDLGVIPGSMASPGYVVRGRGSIEALDSASHGAGRVMSRSAAKRSLTWSDARKLLRDRGVRLLSAGLDEVPMVYKDIDVVMSAQTELVDVLARFDPRIVKMAPAGERAED